MLSDRLAAALPLMSDASSLLISLDDKESAILREAIRPIALQRLGEFVWRTRNTDNRVVTNFSLDHESVHVYVKPGSALQGRIIDRSSFKNPDGDPRGDYTTDPLTGKANAVL